MKNTFTIPILAQKKCLVNTFFESFLRESARLNILNILWKFHKFSPIFENNFHFFAFFRFFSENLKKTFIYILFTIGVHQEHFGTFSDNCCDICLTFALDCATIPLYSYILRGTYEEDLSFTYNRYAPLTCPCGM